MPTMKDNQSQIVLVRGRWLEVSEAAAFFRSIGMDTDGVFRTLELLLKVGAWA